MAVLLAMTTFGNINLSVRADDPYTIEIGSFEQLMTYVQMSKNENFVEPYQWTLKLTADIELTEQNAEDLKKGVYDLPSGEKLRSVTFGCQEKKFSGIFDGQGHTISGLIYDAGEGGYLADNGLFSYTDGAVIKNLIIKDANIDSDYRGGFLVGSGKNSTFENITVQDSYLRVSCSNNVLTLVTDGGLSGGGIAGEAVNCIFYNCESNHNVINNNNTAGVAALGGKGLYLGGLVGTADENTLIEYSRVIGGEVKSHYDVAVGALGGNTLYVGGIAGQLQKGSKVLDCFATPYLYYYAATYVSVGAGNAGHIGGIAAAVYGSRCEIERCHFAGTMESKQYNAILVIPIIQRDVNLSGLVDKWSPGTVTGSYYRESKTGDADVLGNDTVTSEYGPKDDETYSNRGFWESHDYDFSGSIKRNTKYSKAHTNQWVMNYDQGIPVHGISVAAAFDFPGAGTVAIGGTSLAEAPVTTEDAFHFAIQAVNPRELSPQISITAVFNDGYDFYGWYKESDYLENYVTKISQLEEISHNASNKVSEKTETTASMEGNDLFVACVKAKVNFHDLEGKEIASRYYTYEEKLDYFVVTDAPDGTKFYGWTTKKSSEEGGGYLGINSVKLSELETAGEIYFFGDMVTKPMDLYPIYTSYVSNVLTIFEGNEQDSSKDVTLREGVGKTGIGVDAEGNVYIEVTAEEEGADFPDGYHFMGWYQMLDDGTEVLVSTDTKYIVSDLTDEATYMARFEYRVDYYSTTKDAVDKTMDEIPFASIWHKYQEIFQNLRDVPLDAEDTFSHWASDSDDKCDETECSGQIPADHRVTAPMRVWAHVNGTSNYDILITSDFPMASSLSNSGTPALGSFTIKCAPYEGYHFIVWACEAENGKVWSYDEEEWKAGIHVTERNYHYEAHLNANVNFYKKDHSVETVTRHYKEATLLETGVTHAYTYPITGETVDGYSDYSEASPSNISMEKEGYAFLGWISSTEVIVGSDEWNYIYDVSGDNYCTSDPTKVQPYLVTDTDVVTETKNLYPVYAKYHVKTTTNIEALTLPAGVHKPSLPIYVPNPITTTDSAMGIEEITLTAEHNKTIVVDGQEQKYQLIGFTCEVDGVVTELLSQGTESGDGLSYSFVTNVQAGKSYLFTAVYQPVVVVYHLDDDVRKMVIKNTGDELGYQPEPNYGTISGIDQAYFIGWTNEEPSGSEQWILESVETYLAGGFQILDSTTTVNEALDLYPIFIKSGILVDSNIDHVITADGKEPGDVRYIEKTADNAFAVIAEEYPGYVFQGWYVNYGEAGEKRIGEEQIYQLSAEEFLQEQLFTAVYAASLEVRYHGLDGTVIYTANVLETDDRTFVEIVEGKEVPVDTEAFISINGLLDSNQLFRTWYYQSGDTQVEWDSFKEREVQEIIKELNGTVLDLYPIIYEATAVEVGSDEISIGWDNTGETSKVIAELLKDYTEPVLTIHVEELVYGETGMLISENQEEIEVDLTLTDAMGGRTMTEETDSDGNAVFVFNGYITITKTVKDGDGTGVFLFDIINQADSDKAIAIVVNESTTQQDNSVKIKVPYGTYQVVENNDWAWRYMEQTQTVTISATNNDVTCTFENTLENEKWFASETRNENVFDANVETE